MFIPEEQKKKNKQTKLKVNSNSWFATTWQGGHVGGQNNTMFPRRIYMKIECTSSQRRKMLLFLTTNMAAVTSRANQQSPNNHGNFICVFECTIVNLATYRQIGWLKTKQNKTKAKQKRREIKIALSLGYPNSYFYNKRCNMLL